jgi:hypothetical protein
MKAPQRVNPLPSTEPGIHLMRIFRYLRLTKPGYRSQSCYAIRQQAKQARKRRRTRREWRMMLKRR